MSEAWRPVVGYEGLYEVSNIGRVKSLYRSNRRISGGGILKLGKLKMRNKNKYSVYARVCLYRNGVPASILVHQLVAAAFIGPCPKGKEVNHKDLDGWNNADWNLEYMTHQGNCVHAWENGAEVPYVRTLEVRRKMSQVCRNSVRFQKRMREHNPMRTRKGLANYLRATRRAR